MTTIARHLHRLLSLVVAGFFLSAPALAGEGRPNFALPTLVGKQVWRNGYVHAGWRIQENILTGHFRLLDATDRRCAWGAYEECKA